MLRNFHLNLSLILIFILFSCQEKEKSDEIRISGTVEVDRVRLAPEIGGRILEISLEQGSVVKKGDAVVKLDCSELDLQMKQASAVLKGASAKYELVKKGARKEDISQMQEVVKQAKIGVDKLAKDLERAQDLLNSKSIPQKQFDDLKAAHDLASAQLAAVSQQYKKILNGALPEEIEAVQAMVEQAESTIEIIKKKMSYCALLSPVSGTVIQKLSLKGELAPPGMPVGIIADLTHVKVKGFVAEDELGFIKIGNTAKIFIDSQPDSPVEGKISFISSEAEFTPKNIQTQKERVKTMYEIQASVDNSEGKLKDGMPADIVIKK